MSVTVNGNVVRHGTISMPSYGAWHARFVVDADAAPDVTGRVSIAVEGGATLSGTTFRVGDFEGRTEVWVVAGANGLATALVGKFYDASPARLVVTDVASESGEALSSTSDSAILSTLIPKWMRIAGTAGRGLALLTTHLGVTWRTLDDGSIWIGTETWPAFTGEFDLIEESPMNARTTIADDALALRPGMTLDGRNVSYVQHCIEPGSFRTEAWLA